MSYSLDSCSAEVGLARGVLVPAACDREESGGYASVSCLNTAAPCASPETLKLLETGIRALINTAVLQNSYYTANPSQRLGRPKR